VQEYYESFINTVKVIEHCGGDIGVDRSLVGPGKCVHARG
jgi:hypothetical protein